MTSYFPKEWNYNSIVFFDCETTGLDYKKDQITQFAAYYLNSDGYNDFNNTYVRLKEGTVYPKNVQELTRLYPDFLNSQGVDEEMLALIVYDLLNRNYPTLLVAHNAQFDMLFIYELLSKYRLDITFDIGVLDTVTITRDRKPFPHRLVDLKAHYKLLDDDESQLHTAHYDTLLLVHLFYSLLNERNNLEQYINVIGVPPKKSIMGYKLPSVKYVEQPWFHYHNCEHTNVYEQSEAYLL